MARVQPASRGHRRQPAHNHRRACVVARPRREAEGGPREEGCEGEAERKRGVPEDASGGLLPPSPCACIYVTVDV